eukprot:809470-Amorphochlora_amoeboformis.AAC.1
MIIQNPISAPPSRERFVPARRIGFLAAFESRIPDIIGIIISAANGGPCDIMMIGFEVFSHPLAPVGVAVTFLALGGLYMWYSAYSARKKQTMYESPAFWDRRYASIMANEIPPQEW